ncbi:MAG: LamG domain-containing protein [Planctomycetota bacterium]
MKNIIMICALVTLAAVFGSNAKAENPVSWNFSLETSGVDVATSPIPNINVDVGYQRYNYNWVLSTSKVWVSGTAWRDIDMSHSGSAHVDGGVPFADELILHIDSPGIIADFYLTVDSGGFGRIALENITLGTYPPYGVATRAWLEGNVTVTAVTEPPTYVIGLEIVGPNEVAENFSANYKAIAHYDDDSARNVTDLALWSVEPNTYASIDQNGLLRTTDIIEDQSAIILASYTEGDVTVEDEKLIDIFPICPAGTALQFDGVDDYIIVPDHYSLDLFDGMTIQAWIKSNSTSGPRVIVSKWNDNTWDHSYIFKDHNRSNMLRIELSEGGHNDLADLEGTTPITIGDWIHVATTFDLKTVKLYFDGIEDGSQSAVGTIQNSDTTLLIGAVFTGGGIRENFKGLIDEVAIYNRALSAEEIQANMHMKLRGDEPGLIAYWDFDEGEGQIVYDLSGNGNDGYLGSDPFAADDSDPAWVESDAPIGICNPYLTATMATERALERKTAILEELLAALAEEWTAYEALEELLESGDYGDLNKGDIVKAKQKIHSATQHQEQAIDALEKSVEKLQDALNALGYEPEPPVPI